MLDIHNHHGVDPATAETLSQILTQLREIKMDLSQLQSAFTSFKTDFSTFSTDVQAKLTALAANQSNPQDQATVNQIAADMVVMDTTVKQMDANLNPPSTTAAPTS